MEVENKVCSVRMLLNMKTYWRTFDVLGNTKGHRRKQRRRYRLTEIKEQFQGKEERGQKFDHTEEK
jgi:hypothetical protein